MNHNIVMFNWCDDYPITVWMILADLKEIVIIMYLFTQNRSSINIDNMYTRYTSYNRVDIVQYIDNLLYNKLYRYSVI